MSEAKERDEVARRVIFNLPNTLTIIRIISLPFCAWALLADRGENDDLRILSWFLFFVVAMTDVVDGRLARASNQITDFGEFWDPIADKALIGSALIILSLRDVFPWWATTLILIREIGITIWRLRIRNRQVHAANYGGKLKTTLQIAGVGFAFWPVDGVGGALLNPFGVALLWSALVVTLYTGFIYIREFRSA